MPNAKTIDRLELTRRKFNRPQQSTQDNHKGDICPRCHQPTLIHTEGCERCPNCGYDACAWREV